MKKKKKKKKKRKRIYILIMLPVISFTYLGTRFCLNIYHAICEQNSKEKKGQLEIIDSLYTKIIHVKVNF